MRLVTFEFAETSLCKKFYFTLLLKPQSQNKHALISIFTLKLLFTHLHYSFHNVKQCDYILERSEVVNMKQ